MYSYKEIFVWELLKLFYIVIIWMIVMSIYKRLNINVILNNE